MRGREHTRLIGGVVALVVIVGAWWAWPSDGDPRVAGPPGSARVVEVVDGDTLRVEVDGTTETVRMLGIDTPETHHPTKPVECFGAEASARLAELAPAGAIVRLERDVEARDHYDRLLAYVYVTGADGSEILANASLVGDGFAVALAIDPNRAHRGEIAALEQQARASGAGLWGTCGGPGVAIDAVTGR
jgi:micrococcal nuclease